MPSSASEIDKMETTKKNVSRRQYTEAYHVEAVRYYLKGQGDRPRQDNQGLREGARGEREDPRRLGDQLRGRRQGEARQDRRAGTPDEANRRIGELEMGNEFLKKRAPSSPETERGGQVPPDAGGVSPDKLVDKVFADF